MTDECICSLLSKGNSAPTLMHRRFGFISVQTGSTAAGWGSQLGRKANRRTDADLSTPPLLGNRDINARKGAAKTRLLSNTQLLNSFSTASTTERCDVKLL